VYLDFDPTFSSETSPDFDINIPYPADFEIRFSDRIADTSESGNIGSPKTPVKFSVWNRTEGVPAKFLFRDVVKDSTITPDTTESVILYFDNLKTRFKINTSWRMTFETDTLQSIVRPPLPGDIFRIATTKPFRTGDVFRFSVQSAMMDPEKAKTDLDDVAVVPNPYVAAATWEPRNAYRFGRGERRLWFIHLPEECTIRIYTVSGSLVDEIEHHGGMTDGAETWDLVSKDGMDIAYGIYVFHVDAPGIGQTIGKFAVIK
jgi:hypothetical protein